MLHKCMMCFFKGHSVNVHAGEAKRLQCICLSHYDNVLQKELGAISLKDALKSLCLTPLKTTKYAILFFMFS